MDDLALRHIAVGSPVGRANERLERATSPSRRPHVLVVLLLVACEPDVSDEEETPEWLLEVSDEAPGAPTPEERSEDHARETAPQQAGTIGTLGPRVVEASRREPRWELRVDRPWTLTLGRGSGRTGLDTVEVDHVGRAVVIEWRREERRDVRATVEIDREALQLEVLTLAPTELKDHYYEPFMADGTQWIFRIVQGERTHVVYCDNRVPDRLDTFARALDGLLAEAHVEEAPVTRLPSPVGRERRHDASLWDAIEAMRRGEPRD